MEESGKINSSIDSYPCSKLKNGNCTGGLYQVRIRIDNQEVSHVVSPYEK